MKRKYNPSAVLPDLGSAPLIEMTGNRRITVEGSTGVLLYESESVKINTSRMVICFKGRGLTLKRVSDSCVEIDGYVCMIEFVC